MGFVTKKSYEKTKASKIKLAACLIFGFLFLLVAVLSMVMDPIRMLASYSTRIDYGSPIYEILTKEINGIHISAYLFNVTNAEKFLSGEDDKLKVQEVGPFTYQENRIHEDFELDHTAGVMRYTPKYKVTFIPEESVGDPEEMIVTMPNVAMLAMGSRLSPFNYITKMGYNVLVTQLRTKSIITMSAHDYLWGYNEPLVQFGNRFFPGWIRFEKLGLLDRLYDKNLSLRLEVGNTNYDKFMVKTVNGVGGMSAWGYEDSETRNHCNSFTDGYEGLAYPIGMSPDRPLRLYRNVLCRLIDLDYQGIKVMDFGLQVKGLHYKFTNKTYLKIPENECLCSKGICYEDISDMTPCFYGLPLVLSNAHFYNANPAIYERIEGLTPNEEQHGSEFVIEPTVGMALKTKFSVQVNIKMDNVRFNSRLKEFSNMIVPLCYFKVLQPEILEEQVSVLRMVLVYLPYFLLGSQIILMIASVLLLGHSARLLYWNWLHASRNEITFDLQTKDDKEVATKPPMKR